MERRFLENAAASVVVEDRGDDGPVIVGYASVYYDGTAATEFELWTGAVERIMPGTFDRALKDGDDARALFNHEPSQLLGRRSADTLTLASDAKGLRYEIAPGNTTTASDVIEHIRRGDLQGSSFSFSVTDQDWRTEDKIDIREIKGVELFDVGPVTYPAYEGTTTGVRANSVDDALESWRAHQKRVRSAAAAAAARARALELDAETAGA